MFKNAVSKPNPTKSFGTRTALLGLDVATEIDWVVLDAEGAAGVTAKGETMVFSLHAIAVVVTGWYTGLGVVSAGAGMESTR